MARNKTKTKTDDDTQLICRNKRAFHEYNIYDTIECGIVLTGTEVKSLREGSGNLEDSYAKIKEGELWLVGSDIPEYTMGNRMNHKPKRNRKLLIKRRELDKFAGKASQRGYTLVPVRMYFKRSLAKVEVAVARGKQLFDKRESQKKAQAKRDIQQAMKNYRQKR